MLTTDPQQALTAAHERARHLRAEASAERFRRAAGHRTLAASLRSLADRLDPAPFTPRPA